jgi:hypothetical protein
MRLWTIQIPSFVAANELIKATPYNIKKSGINNNNNMEKGENEIEKDKIPYYY